MTVREGLLVLTDGEEFEGELIGADTQVATGEVVPYVDTLPSEDGRFWRCHQPNGVRRCFFAPPGMS